MANNKEIIDKIGSIIADIADQYKYLSKNSEDINELEMELLMANATFLANHIAILQRLVKSLNHEAIKAKGSQSLKLNTSDHSQSEIQHHDLNKKHLNSTINKQSINESHHDVESKNWKQELVDEKTTSFDFEKKGVEELYDRPLTVAEKQLIDQKMEIGELPHPKSSMKVDDFEKHSEEILSKSGAAKIVPQPEELQVKKITATADQPATLANKQTINDVHKRVVENRFGKHRGKNLKELINLNDKLLFIKDLFGDYSLAYGEAIEQLNQFDRFEAAEHFLKANYSKKNNWSDKQASVDKFYEILRKKF